METIVAVATLFDGVVYSVPQPARHNHVIHLIATTLNILNVRGEEGFLTSTGRFVDRYEGAAIAIAAKQLIIRSEEKHNYGQILERGSDKLNRPPKLYSEDVW